MTCSRLVTEPLDDMLRALTAPDVLGPLEDVSPLTRPRPVVAGEPFGVWKVSLSSPVAQAGDELTRSGRLPSRLS